ncbi:MAG: Fic family protein [Myxococcales bacterium]|nr:Fic family protein [Myxococcales bacterium]
MARVQDIVAKADPAKRDAFEQRLEMSWIYHDSVLEGNVYTPEELTQALSDGEVTDTNLIPVFDEIRNHKRAIALVRELADKKRLSISLDVIKKIYGTLNPEEAEGKGPPKYRKEIPLHRLYFHDIAPPDKISYRVRQLLQWMGSAETKRSMHTVRLAAKAHYELLQIYPFPKHSGKVARLIMNLILIRQGYPPVIVHATERQRYYDALKTSFDATAGIVTEALGAAVESTIHFFENDGRAA